MDVLCGRALDLLGWQVEAPLNELAAAAPDALRAALTALWAAPLRAEHADEFWRILDPALDRLKPGSRKAFNGLDTRTTVATYFLYVANPTRFPFYMLSYGGKFITHVYGKSRIERLADGSPGILASAYTQRCAYLLRAFNEAGLELKDMMDLHSAVHVYAREHLQRRTA